MTSLKFLFIVVFQGIQAVVVCRPKNFKSDPTQTRPLTIPTDHRPALRLFPRPFKKFTLYFMYNNQLIYSKNYVWILINLIYNIYYDFFMKYFQ